MCLLIEPLCAQDFLIKKSADSYPPVLLKEAFRLDSVKKYDAALQEVVFAISQLDTTINRREYIAALDLKARIYRRKEGFMKALPIVEKAASLSRNNLSTDDLLLSRVYQTLGEFRHRIKDYFNARSILDSSLVFYHSSTAYDSSLYRNIIDYKYYAYYYSGGSTDTLLKYLEIRREDLRYRAENHDPEAELYILQDYADLYQRKGDLERALSYAIETYKYTLEHKDTILSEPIDRDNFETYANSYIQLFRILYYRNDDLEALEVGLELERLLSVYKRTPENYGEYYAVKKNIGLALADLGRYDEALDYYKEVLEIGKGNLNSRLFYAMTELAIGNALVNLRQFKEARQHIDSSLAIYKNSVSMPSTVFFHLFDDKGDLEGLENRSMEAFLNYDSAIANTLTFKNSSIFEFPKDSTQILSLSHIRTLEKKAKVMQFINSDTLKKQELLLASLRNLNALHQVLIDRRKEFSASEGKLFLSKEYRSLYENAINAAYKLYRMTGSSEYIDVALTYMQRSKSILFLEQQSELEKVNNNIISQDLKYQFSIKRKMIDQLEASFYPLLKSDVTSDSMIRVNDLLNSTRADFDQVMDSINFELSQVNYQSDFSIELPSDSIIENLEGDETLVEYFVGDSSIFVVSLSHSKKTMFKVVKDVEFDEALEDFLNILTQPPQITKFENQQRKYLERSVFLFEQLLSKVLADSQGIKNLIIIPDGFLSRIPFEALVVNRKYDRFEQMSYLINDYAIQYALSSSNLNKESLRSAPNTILGLGFSSNSGQENLKGLPGTETEINALKSSYTGTFINSASKEQFIGMAKDYDILHLAVHGLADTINKYESRLVFSKGIENELKTADLYMASLNARLAILSACESGIGLVQRGEGTFSIARGFAMVGVSSVVMSLWNVNDKITAHLMNDTYHNFIDRNHSINTSLRSAKLNYLKSSDSYLAHPYYWASFIQLGEDISYNEKKRNISQLTLMLGLLLISLITFWVVQKRKRT